MQEINDLKNLVLQSLDAHGVLGQIRAQLRSSVFKIIESQESQSKTSPSQFFWQNENLKKMGEEANALIALDLIHDFFTHYKFNYTTSVFTHESGIKEPRPKSTLSKDLNIQSSDSKPLLLTLIEQVKSGTVQKPQPPQPKQEQKQPPEQKKEAPREIPKEIEKKPVVNEPTKKAKAPLVDLSKLPEIPPQKPKPKVEEPKPEPPKIEEKPKKKEVREPEPKEEFNPEEHEEEFGEMDPDDPLAGSQSHGFDMSVDSMALEEYDYVEDIE